MNPQKLPAVFKARGLCISNVVGRHAQIVQSRLNSASDNRYHELNPFHALFNAAGVFSKKYAKAPLQTGKDGFFR